MSIYTYSFEICFNDKDVQKAGINIYTILEPMYQRWKAKWYAHYRNLDHVKQQQHQQHQQMRDTTIEFRGIRPEYVLEMIEYFRDYPYLQLRCLKKTVDDPQIITHFTSLDLFMLMNNLT